MEGVIEIIGTIVIEGGKYLISKALDDLGNWIWRAFTDEDGDGVPDEPENPFREWDEEPEDWDPFDPIPVDPVVPVDPVEPDTSNDTQIIIVSPDGSMMIYDEAGNTTAGAAKSGTLHTVFGCRRTALLTSVLKITPCPRRCCCL